MFRGSMRDHNCSECNRLWREYACATHEDIKLDGQLKIAALRHDPGLYEQLAIGSKKAAQERESVWEQIKRHEATHNGFVNSPERADF
jgi:hypothetical protein